MSAEKKEILSSNILKDDTKPFFQKTEYLMNVFILSYKSLIKYKKKTFTRTILRWSHFGLESIQFKVNNIAFSKFHYLTSFILEDILHETLSRNGN